MSNNKVIIIGAGLAGMSAASYLQMNGYDTQIFEMHDLPGGLCTSWKRKEYMIDGCIHFMVGTAPGESTYQFWNGLIDMQKLDFVYYNNHCSINLDDDHSICFYSNVDELENELLTKAPEDAKHIKWFVKYIRKFLSIQLPTSKPIEAMNMRDKMNTGKMILPYAIKMIAAMRMTNKQFVEKLQNPYLKEAFKLAFVEELPIFSTMLTMVWRHNRQMGYPKGGAIKIAKLIEDNYINLGGKINYNAKIETIITHENKATGILLENGESHTADIVISAADGRSTIYSMLKGQYMDEHVRDRYEGNGEVFEPIDKTLYVSLGIDKDFSAINHKTYFKLKTPIQIDAKTKLYDLELTHYCEDPSAAPVGKSLLTLMPNALDWEYWNDLRTNNRTEYKQQKERIAQMIIQALDDEFGGVKDHVEMIDVATPATYIRYTGNWTGGQISWKSKKTTMRKPTLWNIDGLDNFYMVGQWSGVTGGLNHVVMMGNHLAQIVCKKHGRQFVTRQF